MIELKYVDKRYPTSNALLYIHELKIGKGEVVGILGENGSGKTTLLKAIMGIGELQNGEITIEGQPVVRQYERMAFITEEGGFLPNKTPLEYADFLSAFFPRFDRPYFEQLLERFELPTRRKARTFSKGQKMKLEMSAGLAKRPDYLLLDEPFVGKDVFSRRDSLKLMMSGLRGDETVLITTHLIDEIENVIDRAIVLHKGLIRADFRIDDLREEGRSLTDAMEEVRQSSPYYRN
ncbi:ABC transporter ATP-binding protein [Cohnella sp. CIP 111063]|uniref:ATP-binding cassette domain-containing protein n=1 Tax=unclassified Cohnella TaxID=2636738 RepID=UPI000B8C0084|nr:MULTISPECIES: ABC transporter ATP-binding protein [unclassified Cohnella]OXS56342.1 ABC transporter ATP-binding protein [Cohnella sp. CIP 111063]PRX67963.1 ABC-2 type transport system ATP-binding protein [Cohnella sp. SGD-V74]